MKFGYVFRYLAKLRSGETVQWRVFAETRSAADAKVDTYLTECKNGGFFNIPIKVEYFGCGENLVLY